ncbi:MAG: YbhB/YbcL family Raf kinase inhibitor-like protein [Alphaproteobacteria bacterium]|nr:YbhB/YbcL family Raf kinase inhibitor-like protein [Alphaproteobacteria bacterium]
MQNLDVTVEGLEPGGRIAREFAFGVPADDELFTFGPNISPAVSWSAGPDGTKSYAVIMHDASVPTVFDDANQEGKTISADLARMDFYHWILVDVPAAVASIAKGAESDAVVAKGKPIGPVDYGVRGANNFGMFMAGNDDMAGDYGGYDGPAPPWNDEIMHEYHFTVYALDVESLDLSGAFSGQDALAAMEGHILAKGGVMGLYTLTPSLM